MKRNKINCGSKKLNVWLDVIRLRPRSGWIFSPTDFRRAISLYLIRHLNQIRRIPINALLLLQLPLKETKSIKLGIVYRRLKGFRYNSPALKKLADKKRKYTQEELISIGQNSMIRTRNLPYSPGPIETPMLNQRHANKMS